MVLKGTGGLGSGKLDLWPAKVGVGGNMYVQIRTLY